MAEKHPVEDVSGAVKTTFISSSLLNILLPVNVTASTTGFSVTRKVTAAPPATLLRSISTKEKKPRP